MDSIPASAAYEATDALVFPVDATATRFMPKALATDMPVVIPLSFNDPVGFSPSCFKPTLSHPTY